MIYHQFKLRIFTQSSARYIWHIEVVFNLLYLRHQLLWILLDQTIICHYLELSFTIVVLKLIFNESNFVVPSSSSSLFPLKTLVESSHDLSFNLNLISPFVVSLKSLVGKCVTIRSIRSKSSSHRSDYKFEFPSRREPVSLKRQSADWRQCLEAAHRGQLTPIASWRVITVFVLSFAFGNR